MFVDGSLAGISSRQNNLFNINLFARINSTLTIVVESLGRVNYGSAMTDFKVFNPFKQYMINETFLTL